MINPMISFLMAYAKMKVSNLLTLCASV